MASLEYVQLFGLYIAQIKLMLAGGWVMEGPNQLLPFLISINLIL